MYKEFFRLQRYPFQNTTDPSFFYEGEQQREALARLTYGTQEGRGLMLITGKVGSGKTMLARVFSSRLGPEWRVIQVTNPMVGSQELFRFLLQQFELYADESNIPASQPQENLLEEIRERLIKFYAQGKLVLVIIDEAQLLSQESLEAVRILYNLETETRKLLQVLILGQEELEAYLKSHTMRPLEQRISLRYRLDYFQYEEETDAYIQYRLRAAGGDAYLFPRDCITLIHRAANGCPRLINLVCDDVLLLAYSRNTPRINLALVREATAKQVSGVEPIESNTASSAHAASVLHDAREAAQTRAAAQQSAPTVAVALPQPELRAQPRPVPPPEPPPQLDMTDVSKFAAPPTPPLHAAAAHPGHPQHPHHYAEQQPMHISAQSPQAAAPLPFRPPLSRAERERELSMSMEPPAQQQQMAGGVPNTSLAKLLLWVVVALAAGIAGTWFFLQPSRPPAPPAPLSATPLSSNITEPRALPPQQQNAPAFPSSPAPPPMSSAPATYSPPAALPPAIQHPSAPPMTAATPAPLQNMPAATAGENVGLPLPMAASLRSARLDNKMPITLLASEHFGAWNMTVRDLLATANPGLGGDLERVPAGTEINLPVLRRADFIIDDGRHQYYLYYASFDEAGAAQTQSQSLQRTGQKTVLVPGRQPDNRPLWRLYIGPFARREAAQAAVETLWLKYLPLIN